MNDILYNTEQLPEWHTYFKTYLCVKDPKKATQFTTKQLQTDLLPPTDVETNDWGSFKVTV